MDKRALITGITGQDGSYLAELLIERGYKVYGIQRRTSTIVTERINSLLDNGSVETFYGDLSDVNSIIRVLKEVKPDIVFNLGAMSHVKVSFDIPDYTVQIVALAPVRILESLRLLDMKDTRYYQASSSEIFGSSSAPQVETTTMLPVSPYGCAKLLGYHITRVYRAGYGMFASNGILFNHESPRRGETFVTKKIVRAAVRIKLGKQKSVKLGNLDAKRDWGHARDYMRAVIMIMEHDKPDDWVVATGEYHSVREFADRVFDYLGLRADDYIEISGDYFRPNEVPELLGDSKKISDILGWHPDITFEGLIKDMIESAWKEETVAVNQAQWRAPSYLR